MALLYQKTVFQRKRQKYFQSANFKSSNRQTSVNVMSPKKAFRPRSLSERTTKDCKPNKGPFITPLNVPEKVSCPKCSRVFTSQLLFLKHIKEKNCVELVKQLQKKTTAATAPKSTSKDKNIKVICDECSAPFASYRVLFQHRATSHSIQENQATKLEANGDLKKKKTTKKFAGIPANAKLKNAFAAVKTQTALL